MAEGSRFDLFTFDGVSMPTILFDNIMGVKSRASRADDILLCSYPKSGTHWVWEILNMIVAGKPEYTEHWQNWAFLEYRTEEELNELNSPRVLHSHLYPSMLPGSVWKKRCKIVYLRRDPKDCLVSRYCQILNQNWFDRLTHHEKLGFSGNWNGFFNAYLKGTVPYGSWFDHVSAWRNVASIYPEVQICTVQYEDLKEDNVAEIRKMAEYLERPLPEKNYNEIAEACSFQKLKQVSENVKDQTFHIKWKEGSSGYFRKGIVGDWRNWLTVDQNEIFDRMYEDKMGKKYC